MDDKKISEKLGDYCFDISKIIIASLFADKVFKGLTSGDYLVILIGLFVALTFFWLGIFLNKKGGLK